MRHRCGGAQILMKVRARVREQHTLDVRFFISSLMFPQNTLRSVLQHFVASQNKLSKEERCY
jgi:hypothetical protein